MLWEQQAKRSEVELKLFIDSLLIEAMRKMANIQLATLWYRWAKTERGLWHWEFNHLELGHCSNTFPTPKQPIHNQMWKGSKWAKAHVQLNGANNIVGHYIF